MKQFSPLFRTDPEWFEFEWQEQLVAPWLEGEYVTTGVVRRPHVPTGYYLVCSVAGICGHRHPYVPTIPGQEGETVYDGGGVQWVLTLPTSASVPSVATASYSIEPDGIEIDDQAVIAEASKTRVRLNAEYAEPGCYTITATIIDSDGEEHTDRARFRVE